MEKTSCHFPLPTSYWPGSCFSDDFLQKWSEPRCCLWKPVWGHLLPCHLTIQELHSEYTCTFDDLFDFKVGRFFFFFFKYTLTSPQVSVNFGPHFKYPPKDVKYQPVRASYLLRFPTFSKWSWNFLWVIVWLLSDEWHGLGSCDRTHSGWHAVPCGDWGGWTT